MNLKKENKNLNQVLKLNRRLGLVFFLCKVALFFFTKDIKPKTFVQKKKKIIPIFRTKKHKKFILF